MPPEVGYADTSSDIVKPMSRMKTPRIGHDHEIEIGPPLLKPAPKLVKQPARIEMIENEIAKLEKPDHDRLQVLAVAELGQVLLVVGEHPGVGLSSGSWASGIAHLLWRRTETLGG